jgi:hypothetical protein
MSIKIKLENNKMFLNESYVYYKFMIIIIIIVLKIICNYVTFWMQHMIIIATVLTLTFCTTIVEYIWREIRRESSRAQVCFASSTLAIQVISNEHNKTLHVSKLKTKLIKIKLNTIKSNCYQMYSITINLYIYNLMYYFNK